ncbi:DnaD domain protein [Priestia megaterium]
MAKYRHIHTTFWEDPKVLEEMTPEDKYFYLYILTNPKTTQIGVYQITKKQMALDLGYTVESVNSLLDRFINMHKIIKYNEETRELAVIHWGKYNLYKAGKPIIDCVKKELVEVKDKTLLWELMNHIPNEAVVNEFSRYVYDTYHDTSTTGGQKEKEKEKEKENYTESAYTFYEQNIGFMTNFISQDMNQWIDDFDGNEDVIIEAMKIAVEQNKRNWGYAKAILKDWHDKKARTLADVQALQQEFRNKRNQPSEPQKHYEEIAEDGFLF